VRVLQACAGLSLKALRDHYATCSVWGCFWVHVVEQPGPSPKGEEGEYTSPRAGACPVQLCGLWSVFLLTAHCLLRAAFSIAAEGGAAEPLRHGAYFVSIKVRKPTLSTAARSVAHAAPPSPSGDATA
jgi:hypothetical protein